MERYVRNYSNCTITYCSFGGTNANVDVSGIALATTAGSVTIATLSNPTIQVNNKSLTTTMGAIQVDPDIIPTGQSLTTNIGPYSIQADGTAVILQGENELETAVGSVTAGYGRRTSNWYSYDNCSWNKQMYLKLM